MMEKMILIIAIETQLVFIVKMRDAIGQNWTHSQGQYFSIKLGQYFVTADMQLKLFYFRIFAIKCSLLGQFFSLEPACLNKKKLRAVLVTYDHE